MHLECRSSLHHRFLRRGDEGGAGQDEPFGPRAGQPLAGLVGVVGGEGALPVPLFIPGGQGGVRLGGAGPEVLPFGHQQKAQPAAQLALGVGVQLGAQLLHRLPPGPGTGQS